MNVTGVVAGRVLEFKMEISHIVTNGCSFTYCQGLENPVTQGWPGLLANKLYTDVVNLGLPGVGNDNIYRRTVEYVYKNLEIETHKPLFVIAWSQPRRREAWFNIRKNNIEYSDYHIVSLEKDKPSDDYERALLDNWNTEDFIRKTLLYKISLINLFENLEIPYIMTDYVTMFESEKEKEHFVKKFPELFKAINNKNKAYDLFDISYGLPKLPCGHDDVDAQKAVTNYLYKKINEVYPENVYISNGVNYLRLKEFIQDQKYAMKFPEWCNFKPNVDIIS